MSLVRPNDDGGSTRENAKLYGAKARTVASVLGITFAICFVLSPLNTNKGGLLSIQNDLLIFGVVFSLNFLLYWIGYSIGFIKDTYNDGSRWFHLFVAYFVPVIGLPWGLAFLKRNQRNLGMTIMIVSICSLLIVVATGLALPGITTFLTLASLNSRNANGYTALMAASSNGDIDTVKSLIARHVDLNLKDNDGVSSLMLAAERDDTECLNALIAAGADVNAQDNGGNTALMKAAIDHPSSVQALIAAHANVNAKANGNYTALMGAAQNDNVQSAVALILAGADINATADRGDTAIKLAESHPDMIALLKRAGAKN